MTDLSNSLAAHREKAEAATTDENPADKIKKAKEAREMGRKLREGKPQVFGTGRCPPRAALDNLSSVLPEEK